MAYDVNNYGPDIAAVLKDTSRGTATLREKIRLANVNEAARAGLFLHTGFWNEAHEVAQELHTPDGSYWHAFIHREEPDEFNAGYWFQKAGRHPVMLQMGPNWDRNAFVRATPAQRQREWELLFDYSMRAGI